MNDDDVGSVELDEEGGGDNNIKYWRWWRPLREIAFIFCSQFFCAAFVAALAFLLGTHDSDTKKLLHVSDIHVRIKF